MNVSSAAAAMWEHDSASQEAGIVLEAAEDGTAVVSMHIEARHVNGLGVCHGGYIFLLADTAMAFASNGQHGDALAAGATIEFLRPARLGDTLRAVSTHVTTAGRTQLWQVEVRIEGVPQTDSPVAVLHGRTLNVNRPGQ
jgi:acyl-CoA thioesterase